MPNSYYTRTLNLIPFTLARGADLNAEAQLVENAFDLLPPPRPGGGGFALLDGSASNPALQFQSSSNTGWYLASPGVMAFSVGGTQVATISSSGFGGLGLGLTQLNASSLTTGTIPAGRFPDPLPALSGANLTNLNASNLTSGTVPNARISGGYTNITGIGNTATQLLFSAQGHLTVQPPTANQHVPALTVNGMTVSSGDSYALTAEASCPGYVVTIIRNLHSSGATSIEILSNGTAVHASVAVHQSFGAMFGTNTNHGVVVVTNSASRLTINNVGALTLNAPASGNHTINGAVTFGGAVTLSSTISGNGSGLTNLNASNLASGTIPDARFPATLPAISGANLTNLNASNLASGTIPAARFPDPLPTLSGANLTNLNASNLSSGTIPNARFPDPLPALSGANLTNINASNLASGTVPNARISGAYTNITAIGNGASHLSIATNGNVTCSAQILATANVVARQGSSGNAHFFLRSNTDVEQGILYWDSSNDSVVVGRYNSAGSALENYYSLTSSGTAVVRSTSSSKTVDYTFNHNGLTIQQPGNTDWGYVFFSNGQGERVRLYGTDTRAFVVSCNNGTTAHLTVTSTSTSISGALNVNGDYIGNYKNDAAGVIFHCNNAPVDQKYALLYGWSAGWSLNFYNDSLGGPVEIFTIGRSGTTPTDFVYKVRTRTAPIHLPFSTTLTIDAQQSNVFYVGTLTGNVTSFTINNPADGQTINVRFLQDGIGNRSVALPSGAVVSGSINPNPNSVSWLEMTYVSSVPRWEGNWR